MIELPEPSWEYLKWNALASTLFKLLYISTPKVGCTAVKWWFAELIGVSDSISRFCDSKESAPDLVIHDTLHRVAPHVAGLSPEVLSGIIKSPLFFKFALVRNPYTRIFSAWQSKWLLREPLQIGPYRHTAFFDLPIRNGSDIAIAFEAFLEFLYAQEYPDLKDHHLRSQVGLILPNQIPYSFIGKLEDPRDLSCAIMNHLGQAAHGPFLVTGKNQSLIPYSRELLTDRAEYLIRAMYELDFEEFGYPLQPPGPDYSLNIGEIAVAIKAIHMLRGRLQRIDEIRARAAWEQKSQQAEFSEQITSRDSLIHELRFAAAFNEKNSSEHLTSLKAEMIRAESQLELIRELWLSDGDGNSL